MPNRLGNEVGWSKMPLNLGDGIDDNWLNDDNMRSQPKQSNLNNQMIQTAQQSDSLLVTAKPDIHFRYRIRLINPDFSKHGAATHVKICSNYERCVGE
jgi:hypothetical protein